jgi:hypothetical protein
MDRIDKNLSLLLILIISLTIVGTSSAQSIPKPSVPEFTLKYVDNSYDVPPKTTSSTDPYTGKVTTTTVPGYHVDDRTIQIVIKNQNYKGNLHLYYNYSYKGHYENDWNYHKIGSYPRDSGPSFYYQSTSDYTVITFGAVPKEGEMDFRVQAQTGYYNETKVYVIIPGAPFSEYTFIGEVSGWSNTQTISIPNGSVSVSTSPNPTLSSSPTSNPTPTPSVPEFSGLMILPLIISLLFVAVILKHRHQNTSLTLRNNFFKHGQNQHKVLNAHA